MPITEQVFQLVERLNFTNYFITTEFVKIGDSMPNEIESFLNEKYASIKRGASGRKFKFKESNWVLIFTFFPTNEVVDERYALKNKSFYRQ